MRTLLMAAMLFVPIFASFFPSTVQSSIASSDEKNVKLSHPFPVNGMTGIVVHHFGDGLDAVTGYIAQRKHDGTSELVAKDVIHHDELPSIKTPFQKGDKVIGGYLYNTVLLLAPDADTYAKITRNTHKRWIHPDLFALFLSSEGDATPDRENLAKFAQQYQVGLIYIVKRHSAVLLDPISGKIVGTRQLKTVSKHPQFPFFMRFKSFRTGIFSESGEGDYYKTMEQF